MASWILGQDHELDPTQRALAVRIAEFVAGTELSALDVAKSSAAVRRGAFEITLAHSTDPNQTIYVHATEGEIVVSYGPEHEHFRPSDPVDGRVWPFPSGDAVEGAATLIESLLTGRIEIEMWKRPLAIKTRSYWRDADGERRLFLRGGTVGPFIGWSSEPEQIRFDFRGSRGG